jgi:hypothetical protein
MTSLQDIEAAIKQLPESDVRRLSGWLKDYLDDRWDRQMESDLISGELDRLIARSEADITANQVRKLDEVLRDT